MNIRVMINLVIVIFLIGCESNETIYLNHVEEPINSDTCDDVEINNALTEEDGKNLNDNESKLPNNNDTLIFSPHPIGAYLNDRYIPYSEMEQKDVNLLLELPYYIYTENGNSNKKVEVKKIDNDPLQPNGFDYEARKLVESGSLHGISKNIDTEDSLISKLPLGDIYFYLVRNRLNDAGLSSTPVVISEAYEFDVMGDNSKETIFAAANYNSNYFFDDHSVCTYPLLEDYELNNLNEYEGVGIYSMLVIVSDDDVYFIDEVYQKLDKIYFEEYEADEPIIIGEYGYFVDGFYEKAYLFNDENEINLMEFNQINAIELPLSERGEYTSSTLFEHGAQNIDWIVPLDADEKYELITYSSVPFRRLEYFVYSWNGESFVKVLDEFTMKSYDYDVNYMKVFAEEYVSW